MVSASANEAENENEIYKRLNEGFFPNLLFPFTLLCYVPFVMGIFLYTKSSIQRCDRCLNWLRFFFFLFSCFLFYVSLLFYCCRRRRRCWCCRWRFSLYRVLFMGQANCAPKPTCYTVRNDFERLLRELFMISKHTLESIFAAYFRFSIDGTEIVCVCAFCAFHYGNNMPDDRMNTDERFLCYSTVLFGFVCLHDFHVLEYESCDFRRCFEASRKNDIFTHTEWCR